MMELVKEIEREVNNFNVVWHQLTSEEKHDVAKNIAAKIKQLHNEYQKVELWQRIYTKRNVVTMIANYL